MKKLTTEICVERSIKKHGDKYDYSLVKYNGTHNNIIIICPVHGEFNQLPLHHMRGHGCKWCNNTESKERVRIARDKLTKKISIDRPDVKFISEYVNSKTSILAESKYGLVRILPNSINRGNRIGIDSAVDKTEYFKAEMKDINPDLEIHGEYKTKASIFIIHTDYGDCEMKSDSLRQGRNPSIKSAVNPTKYWINQAKEKRHSKNYIYDKVYYVNSSKNVDIYCKIHKEYFPQAPASHSSGSGCPKCGIENNGYSRSDYIKIADGRDSMLYKLHCWNNNEEFYKVGITFYTVKKRYRGSGMPYNYEILSELKGEAGHIWDLELAEKRNNKECHYDPLIPFKGSVTECFTELL